MSKKLNRARHDHLRFVIQVWRERARTRGGQWPAWAAVKIEEAERALKNDAGTLVVIPSRQPP